MSFPSWIKQIEQDGYCVLPNIIPREACTDFQEEAWKWLESFPYGFDRNDRSTWTDAHMPMGFKGGLYNRYAVNHEAFVWKIRTLQTIKDAFGKFWKTDDLVASFDGINATLPVNKEYGRQDIKPNEAWPHIDQNPHKVDQIQLLQGIANLSPNGPTDGGLVIVAGSHKLHRAYYASHGGIDPRREGDLGYDYSVKDVAWFCERGCKQIKVCAGQGDLILWDSRIIHWNQTPVGKQTRFVAYVAYTPRVLMSEEQLAAKYQIFLDRKGTSGWPHKNIVPSELEGNFITVPTRPDGSHDPADRARPRVEPAHTPEVLYAVGVRS